MIFSYSLGLFIARVNDSTKLKSVVAKTIKIGKINLTPNTAINIPHVRNLLLQTGDILTKIRALTTALSNDKANSKKL